MVALLLCYLVFDLRPLLLIPNLILYHYSCAAYSNGKGTMELKVFPRLCVAGDPIWAVISSHDLPLGNEFTRNYDRSGLFGSLQFSTATNSPNPVDTLYWTCGMMGGLGGEQHTEKTIWLEDYVRFDGAGRYRLHFRYEELNYDLGDFSIINSPENPVSKFLKQAVLTIMLWVPSDKVRLIAVKVLGYQETAYSTYAVAKYRAHYAGEWKSTYHPYNNSLAETHRGLLRNYDYPAVAKTLRRIESSGRLELLEEYFWWHLALLIYSNEDRESPWSQAVVQERMTNLVACMRLYLDDIGRQNVRGRWADIRREYTDDYWRDRIKQSDEKNRLAATEEDKKRSQREKKYAESRFADKKRQATLELMDFSLQLMDQGRPVDGRGEKPSATGQK